MAQPQPEELVRCPSIKEEYCRAKRAGQKQRYAYLSRRALGNMPAKLLEEVVPSLSSPSPPSQTRAHREAKLAGPQV